MDLRMRDGGLAATQLRRRLVLEGGQDGLDMLAGAQRVGAEVGAFAGIVAQVEAANADAIGAAGGRVADLVVAEDAVAAQVLDAQLLLGGPLAANVDLLLAQHDWLASVVVNKRLSQAGREMTMGLG